jgi:hypothetical protein
VRPKKRPWGASGTGCEQGSSELTLHIENNAFESGLVEDLFLLRDTQEQGAAAEVVDLAGHTLGVIIDSAEETLAEKRPLVTSDAQVVLDIPSSLFQVERSEVVADGDTLVESFVGRKAEFVSEVRLSEEDEGQGRSGIHVVVEQEAELVQEVGGEEMGFVDEEEDVAALARQVGEGSVELREEAGEAEGGLGLELEEDLAVEGDDSEVGVGEVNDRIDVAVEGVGKGAQSGRFSCSDIAGDQGWEALLEGKGQAALNFAVPTGSVEVLAVDRFGERGGGKAVKVMQCGHLVRAPCQRVIRVE